MCFERVFHLLSERLQKRIRWKHIHGGEEGFEAVVSDMDGKQMAGKISRSKSEHVANVFVKALEDIYSILTPENASGHGTLRRLLSSTVFTFYEVFQGPPATTTKPFLCKNE